MGLAGFCLLRTINQARLPVARRLEACATSDEKRCSLSFSNRVPLPDEDRSNFAARLRHHIRCCRFLNLLPHDCGSLGSTGRAEPTAGYSHARSKTFSVVVLSPPAATPSKAVENSVVKIFATLRQPDPTKPWAKKEPSDITASGAVISGKRILTNAHVVQYASEVQVQANQAGDKLPAIVKAVAPGMDLAILELEDEKFFDSHSPLPFKKSLPDSKER